MLIFSAACDVPSRYSPDFTTPWKHSPDPSCHSTLQPYIVKHSPGKGLGAFASRHLEPGDIILQEAPVMRIRPPPFQDGIGYPMKEMGASIREAFESLPKEGQDEVLSLHAYTTAAETASPDVDELVPIYRSNAYTIDKEIALFPKIARINHSCRPNTSYVWIARLNKQVVYATRRIEEGEELSVTYIPLLRNRQDRQKRLDQYGFKCSCEVCAAEEDELIASDRRREEIRQVFNNLEPHLSLEPAESTAARKIAHAMAVESARLVKLVEEEGLSDYYDRAYRIAAICHARTEQWEPAALWAHQSYQLRMMADSQSHETKEMEVLTERFLTKWEQLRSQSKP
ncbi:SET domain-containing protein [Westerdykella ornata]|uniref:SET domain-containing protein n=1 Tax=Westerdykella ornata TaxID=318751 RepID=A0A6A6J6F7_WESOR|nr:SET domain-containing protein [Westerdykella ornata]KAF2272015.1 SET domain-containing protein [Westerdykella ornata]